MARPPVPGAIITAVCPVCEKEYTYKRSAPKKRCSRACYDATRGQRATTICPTCGKEFSYLVSWPRKYCSNVCHGKANVGNIKRFAPSRFTTACEQCGKQFETTPKATRGRFCSRRCWGDWQAANMPRGEQHPRAGVKFGRSARPPNPTVLVCPVCGQAFASKPCHSARRRCCSKRCYSDWVAKSGRFTGANNPKWRGGQGPEYYGPSWRLAQRAARKRDKVCVDCGLGPADLGRELDVHHRTPFRAFGPERHREANDLANLVALCPTCHTRREWGENRIA